MTILVAGDSRKAILTDVDREGKHDFMAGRALAVKKNPPAQFPGKIPEGDKAPPPQTDRATQILPQNKYSAKTRCSVYVSLQAIVALLSLFFFSVVLLVCVYTWYVFMASGKIS